MAAYQGARRRGFELPRPTLDLAPPPAWARRRTSGGEGLVRAGRPTRVGTVLATIVAAFFLAFLSLSQSVRVSATSYDIVRLNSDYERLVAMQQGLRSNLDRLGSEPAIRKLGLSGGLNQLGSPLIVSAR